MGLEAECTVAIGKRKSAGHARLETKDIQFRGGFRLDIPFDKIRRAEAARGILTIEHAEGIAKFELGKAAEKWALKIRYPKLLIDKIGIRPGMRVAIAGSRDGVGEASFWRDLRGRVDLLDARTNAADCILFFANLPSELSKLSRLRRQIKPDGMIWAIYPKGVKTIREADVMAAAKQHGLVDIKNCSFSETHSALKLVIPVAQRRSTGRKGGERPKKP